MASIHGMVAALGNGAYTAAKHGVVGITRNAAAEYGPQGLRINCVGPGYIETPLLTSLPAEFRAALVQRHPLGRLGQPEEVSHLVCFLFSEEASFITGGYTISTAGTPPSRANATAPARRTTCERPVAGRLPDCRKCD
jgi:NAD(P)-dependent dehydrogenase (short-subunit alcohol dehydrogenase family)